MSGGPDLVRLDPAGYRRTPWKNGGGVTVDIAGRHRPGHDPAGWTGMVWRFGRTRIEAPGPFSDLSGHDRILTVIGGRGLVLRVDDGRVLDAREPFRPVRFSGDWTVRSEIEAGPVAVLNLMGDREAVGLDVTILRGDGSLDVPPGEAVLHAPACAARVRIGDREVALADDEAVALAPVEPIRVEGQGGIVAVASVTALRTAASRRP